MEIRLLTFSIFGCSVLTVLITFTVSTQATENAATTTSAESSSNWPGFLGTHRDGIASQAGILTDWTDGKLTCNWQLEVDEGYASGVVADGRYYHFDAARGQGRLRCVDLQSGEEIWRFLYESNYRDLYGYDSGPRASPLLDNNRVYIYGVEGMLYCLDAASGKEMWSVDTARRFGVVQNFFGVGSSPVCFDDLLLVMVGGSPETLQDVAPGALDKVESNGSGVVAFDKQTGEVRYATIDDLASYSSIKLHPSGDQTRACAWMREKLYCFDPQTGKVFFDFPYRSRKLESVNAMTPVIDDSGRIFLSECYEKGSVLLKPVAGGEPEMLWSDARRRDASFRIHWNTPVLIDGYLFGCSGRNSSDADLRCVKLDTGEIMWRRKGLGRTTVTAVDNYLIVLGEHGTLQLIEANPERFVPLTQWQPTNESEELTYPAWAAAIVASGKLIVRGKQQVVCLQLVASD